MNELDFWKELSRQGYTIRDNSLGEWYIEAPAKVFPAMYLSHEEAVAHAKKTLGWSENSKFGGKPKYKVTILYNEGYGKQCVDLDPFEADTKEDAKKIGKEKAGLFFADNPKAEIIEIMVKKWK
jgi:hypothetical protein